VYRFYELVICAAQSLDQDKITQDSEIPHKNMY